MGRQGMGVASSERVLYVGAGTVVGLWVYRPVDPCNRSSGELGAPHAPIGVRATGTWAETGCCCDTLCAAAATSGCGVAVLEEKGI